MKTIVVYDNVIQPNEIIQEVIGHRGFGDVIVKRKLLKHYYMDSVQTMLGKDSFYVEMNQLYDYDAYAHNEEQLVDDDIRVLHCFSDFIITDADQLALNYKKIFYVQEIVSLYHDKAVVAIMFPNLSSYQKFLGKAYASGNARDTIREMKCAEVAVEGVEYIGEIAAFVQCISGNFDSRYFNSLRGNEYFLRKSSTNKAKIQAEYQYYYLLPPHMQRWMVQPYDFQEDEEQASYAMERLYMTDIAIKWVHGSFSYEEFRMLMDMYFTFFGERSSRTVSEEEYQRISENLYVTKVMNRVADLKQMEAYEPIRRIVDAAYGSIDVLVEKYMNLKKQLEAKAPRKPVSVIGHGDPCFANAMYNRATRTLKFIDPKGAVNEAELWTNPYYDIAKLSHSVCGRYDFFNNAMFDISIDEQFRYQLNVPFDNEKYKDIFREAVEANGYDYWLVRVYEASLFLSMLPLHIDYPQKVLGFILNAANILDEVEEHVKGL